MAPNVRIPQILVVSRNFTLENFTYYALGLNCTWRSQNNSHIFMNAGVVAFSEAVSHPGKKKDCVETKG
jgi:hypothetical protein